MEPFGLRLSAAGAITVTGSAGLRAWPLHDGAGRHIATVHGVLLAGWLGPGLRLDGDALRTDAVFETAADFERGVVDRLHGLVAILTMPGGPFGNRLYADAGGSMPFVFCPERRLVAGAADQIFDAAEYDSFFLPLRHRRMVAGEGNGWITGTLTAHRGVFRLLPNHYLDLDSFTAHRFWPRRGEYALTMTLDDAADTVARDLSGYVGAVARQFDAAITLTAGWDSRVLTAAAHEVRDRIGFVTMGVAGSGLDQQVAAELAARFGLRHRLQPVIEASPEAMDRWDRMVGHTVREANRRTHPTLAALPYEVILTGMYGETGRCRLYRQDAATINDAPATASFVLSRLTLPLDPDQVADIEAWLAPIAWLPRSAILDLAFNELKFGTWAVAQGPVQKAMKWTMMPMGQRSIQNAFMSVPPLEKGSQALFEAIVRRLWPELLSMPINRYGDYRDVTSKVMKLFDRERVVRYLRDRFA